MPIRSVLRAFPPALWPFWLVIALLPFGRLAELGTALCVGGCVFALSRDRHALAAAPGARLFAWLLGAYVGAALLSAFAAVAPARSWSTVAGLLRYLPLGLYACLVLRGPDRPALLYRAVALVVACWVLDAWVQIASGYSLGGPAEAERISGIFGAGNLKLGPSLAVLAPFALWTARQWGGRAALLVAWLLLLGPILLAGVRSAWVIYALVTLAFAWREAGSPRRFLGLVLAAAALCALAGALAWQGSPRFHARMERTLAVLQGDAGGVDQALTGRLDIWRAGLRMVALHPLTGVGVRGFRYAYPEVAPAGDHFLVAESCGVGEGACHAHQLVLEVLSETGVLGLALWCAGVALACRAFRRADAASRERAFPATVALGAMLFPLNSHLAFYSAWWGLLFAWLLALWCAVLVQGADDAP
ncbi:MAG: O-antigen ligase family protein [Fulvimonas sp.]|nr:O-antigen ligase family protein [Fulvimonas sp.]